MDKVTLKSLDSFIERYAKARGGEMNEDTESEAMFVFSPEYGGAFVLSTKPSIMWIGLQNATARFTNKGGSFASVRHAVLRALTNDSPTCVGGEVYYSGSMYLTNKAHRDEIESA